jgi:hypothetical protein
VVPLADAASSSLEHTQQVREVVGPDTENGALAVMFNQADQGCIVSQAGEHRLQVEIAVGLDEAR